MKQHLYIMDPVKQQFVREGVQYLLDNDVIEPNQSEWSSPCILVQKPDGTLRMCTHYRSKENSVTKTDTFPIPRADNCIDNIGQAKYVLKFDKYRKILTDADIHTLVILSATEQSIPNKNVPKRSADQPWMHTEIRIFFKVNMSKENPPPQKQE